MIITIDGPTASGKSTVARALAQKLQLYYLNTGFLYRGLAYLLQRECNYDEACFANPQEKDLRAILDPQRFVYRYDARAGETILFDGCDITPFLKTPDIATRASKISVYPMVREYLLDFQRELAKENGLVAEGRDTGSVVFASADIKFFLTASIEHRAQRYMNDATRKETPTSIDEIIAMIAERDRRDQERTVSPLIVPHGAIVIDNSKITLQETTDLMLTYIQEKSGK